MHSKMEHIKNFDLTNEEAVGKITGTKQDGNAIIVTTFQGYEVRCKGTRISMIGGMTCFDGLPVIVHDKPLKQINGLILNISKNNNSFHSIMSPEASEEDVTLVQELEIKFGMRFQLKRTRQQSSVEPHSFFSTTSNRSQSATIIEGNANPKIDRVAKEDGKKEIYPNLPGYDNQSPVYNEDSMYNNQQILPRADLAFEALLRHRAEITLQSQSQYDVLIQYKLKKEIPLFLQYIANGDPNSAKELLENNPQLAVVACGTVTTSSGNTYENVTAVQLAYVVDDDDMCNSILLPYIKKLPEDMIKQADEQLTKKMAEVEKLESEFKPYDFSVIVKVITADETLKVTGKAGPETEEALDKFKEDFKPGVIKRGKSFINEHLQEGYKVCGKQKQWNVKQLLWFLINITATMQDRVEKCWEQEFSQGLCEILLEKKPRKRSVILKNKLGDSEMTYRQSADSKLLLGRDFFVEIYHGLAESDGAWMRPCDLRTCPALEECLVDLFQAKKSGMEQFKQQLQKSYAFGEPFNYSKFC